MVVITALMGTVILGGMALTVDLSLHTFNQRTLQNVADAAALAGATDLQRVPTTAQQQLGLTDALSTIQQNQSFPNNWTGSSTATACTIGTLAGLCETVNYLNYTVKISTPPQTAKAPTNVTQNDFEVDMSVNVSNNFGAFVGAATSTVGARAVAYHSGPPSPYSYTFFASTEVDSGNQPETIVGDAYVGSGYVGSSKSNAGLCVSELPGNEPAGDPDSDPGVAPDSDVDDQGHVTFGSLPPVSQNGVPNGDPIYGSTACSLGKIATQTLQSPPANCPAGATPTRDLNGLQCLQVSPTVPTITLPTPNKPALLCGTTVSSTTPAGIYPVTNACTINVSFATGDINCVDLVLGVGSSVNVVDKSGLDYMTSWDYTSNDPTAKTAIYNLFSPSSPPNLTTTCPGAQTTNIPTTFDSTPTQVDTCVICANPSSASCSPGVNTCPIALTDGSTGCCSDSLFVGTVFLPGQEIMFKSNQSMEDVGQIYCGFWAVSSGNHPNPVVTRDNGATDQQLEILRLVE
ncbi:MAG TPA: pilus assembly protein TadG-related protein [Candidatus Dormibacteraeota bacterium]